MKKRRIVHRIGEVLHRRMKLREILKEELDKMPDEEYVSKEEKLKKNEVKFPGDEGY